MTSEPEAGPQRGALLVGKSKPKVKIRQTSREWKAPLLLLLLQLAATVAGRDPAADRPGPKRADEPKLRGLVAMAAAGGPAGSELSFEFLGLRHVPSAQLCELKLQSQVNSMSFASNRIKSVEPDAFSCVGQELKILSLRNNRIESLAEEAFAGLAQLQVLLLDGNNLDHLPRTPLSRLPALRHLNLAYNKIGAIDAGETLAAPSLISLNLRGNPLQRIHWRALSGLTRLKTLTLAQVELAARQLERPDGLAELRFAHLDQLGAHLGSLDGLFCESSRKLATLSLKLNQLEQVPALANCQGLLSLDLSYNKIQGTLAANFSRLGHLIDLYLGHNQLEHLAGAAFAGLNKLQVLELNSNRLKWIHADAFLPVRATLYELNIAHNAQLDELPAGGLERLISLKAYGNNRLRRLPAELPAARLLVLTFAYHCCDYVAEPRPANASVALDELGGPAETGNAIERPPLPIHHATGPGEAARVTGWTDLVLSKLAQIWPGFRPAGEPAAGDESAAPIEERPAPNETADSSNLSELLLWRRRMRRRGVPSGAPGNRHHDEYFTTSAPPEARPPPARQDRAEFAGRPRQAAVIDELIWQASKIRSAHLQAADGPIKAPAEAQDDDERLLARIGPVDDSDGAGESGELELEFCAELVARALAQELSLRYAAAIRLPDLPRSAGEWSRPPSKRAAGGPPQTQPDTQAGGPARPPVQCLPRPNAFQPCRDLFDSVWLRASISLVFLLAFAGNILVIVVLSSVKPSSSTSALTSIMWFNAAQSKRHIDVPRFLVINLAVADLLMAVYLGLLAFVDLSTLGEFRFHAIQWQHSAGCKLAGFLAVLSSELSVFILAVITLERNYAITNAVHLNRRLSLQKAMVVMFFGYLYALTMALLPLNGVNDYRKFSVCLPLDFEPGNLRSAASLYLISLISINALSFVLLLGCYLRMYCAIRGSQAWSTNDLKIAKRMSILVATDFLCWSPLILVAATALFGRYLVGADGLKVLVIFVLPLNSVANPFLYAITTKKFARDLALLKKRLRVEQTSRALSRLAARLAPICCSRRGADLGALGKNATASLTVRADTGWEQVFGKGAAKKAARLKRSPTDYRLVMEETRVASSRQRSRAKLARCEAELILVNQSGRSVLASRADQTNAARLCQLRPASVAQPAPAGAPLAPDRMAGARCPACSSRLVHAARPLERARSSACRASDSSNSGLQQKIGRPRIVLDSVEPAHHSGASDCAQPASLHCSRNLLATGADANRCWSPVQEGQTPQALLHQAARRKLSASDSIRVTQHCPAWAVGEQEKRASSADKPRETRVLTLPAGRDDLTLESPRRRGPSRLVRLGSSRPLIVQGCPGEYDHEFLDCGMADSGAPSNRSVSACAFEWPNTASEHRGAEPKYLVATPARACCSCSCEAIRAGGSTRNHPGRRRQIPAGESRPHTRTRSFSRFVFEPIAKAWSSLQLSLQLGPGSHSGAVATGATTRLVLPTASGRPHVGPAGMEHDQLVVASRPGSDAGRDLDRQSTESEGLLVELNESSIIEDVLLMSSPKRSQLLKGRRMSRSCDVIVETSTSTTTGAELTSSSFYDQNDDQRILLATINQLNSRGRRKRNQPGSDRPDEHQQAHLSRAPNCTRCRSWSPALLDKLEDCMHQIKSRMPRFKKSPNQSCAAEGGPSQWQRQAASPPHGGDPGPCGPRKQPSRSSSSRCSSSLSLSEALDDEEEDGFNEVGLAEWARNMQKKAPANCYSKSVSRRQRLRQQLSANSDTLSARTVGTTITSVSFDSSSNIPVASSIEDAVHQVMSSSALNTTNNDARPTSDES